MAQKLTTKQRLFVQEYLATKNATQSAINAGYSQKTAKQMGSENLAKPDVRREIDTGLARLEARVEKKIDLAWLTKERWLEEVAALAFSDTTALFNKDANGKTTMTIADIKDRGLGRLIRKIKVDKTGKLEIDTHSKHHALELLGKAKKWVTENIDLTPPLEPLDDVDFENIFNSEENAAFVLKVAKATSKPALKKAKGETK